MSYLRAKDNMQAPDLSHHNVFSSSKYAHKVNPYREARQEVGYQPGHQIVIGNINKPQRDPFYQSRAGLQNND